MEFNNRSKSKQINILLEEVRRNCINISKSIESECGKCYESFYLNWEFYGADVLFLWHRMLWIENQNTGNEENEDFLLQEKDNVIQEEKINMTFAIGCYACIPWRGLTELINMTFAIGYSACIQWRGLTELLNSSDHTESGYHARETSRYTPRDVILSTVTNCLNSFLETEVTNHEPSDAKTLSSHSSDYDSPSSQDAMPCQGRSYHGSNLFSCSSSDSESYSESNDMFEEEEEEEEEVNGPIVRYDINESRTRHQLEQRNETINERNPEWPETNRNNNAWSRTSSAETTQINNTEKSLKNVARRTDTPGLDVRERHNPVVHLGDKSRASVKSLSASSPAVNTRTVNTSINRHDTFDNCTDHISSSKRVGKPTSTQIHIPKKMYQTPEKASQSKTLREILILQELNKSIVQKENLTDQDNFIVSQFSQSKSPVKFDQLKNICIKPILKCLELSMEKYLKFPQRNALLEQMNIIKRDVDLGNRTNYDFGYPDFINQEKTCVLLIGRHKQTNSILNYFPKMQAYLLKLEFIVRTTFDIKTLILRNLRKPKTVLVCDDENLDSEFYIDFNTLDESDLDGKINLASVIVDTLQGTCSGKNGIIIDEHLSANKCNQYQVQQIMKDHTNSYSTRSEGRNQWLFTQENQHRMQENASTMFASKPDIQNYSVLGNNFQPNPLIRNITAGFDACEKTISELSTSKFILSARFGAIEQRSTELGTQRTYLIGSPVPSKKMVFNKGNPDKYSPSKSFRTPKNLQTMSSDQDTNFHKIMQKKASEPQLQKRHKSTRASEGRTNSPIHSNDHQTTCDSQEEDRIGMLGSMVDKKWCKVQSEQIPSSEAKTDTSSDETLSAVESTSIRLYRNIIRNEISRMMSSIDMVMSEAEQLFGLERLQIFIDLIMDEILCQFESAVAMSEFVPNMAESIVRQNVISFFKQSWDTMNSQMTLLLRCPDRKVLQQLPVHSFISLMKSVIKSSPTTKTKGKKKLSLEGKIMTMADLKKLESSVDEKIPKDVLNRLRLEMVVHTRLESHQPSDRKENKPIHSIYFPSDCRLFIYIPTENGSYWHRLDMQRANRIRRHSR